MTSLSEGVRTGAETQARPFDMIFQRLDQADKRRREDQKDLQELNKFFTGMQQQHEYQSQQQQQQFTNQQSLQNSENAALLNRQHDEQFNKMYEPAGPTDQAVPFQGTSFEAIAGQGRYKKANDVESQIKSENLKYLQGINKQMGGGAGSSNNLIYRRADTGEEVSKEEAQAAIANGDKNFLVNQKVISKSGIKEVPLNKNSESNLPPSVRNLKTKMLQDVKTTIENNKVQKEMISDADQAIDKIPTGLIGKAQRWQMKQFDPNNPVLGEWQKIKQVLLNDTLLNTARTKGAISDKEMELFKESAANDDLASKPAMKVVFKKLTRFLDAEEKAKSETYKESFGDDPYGSDNQASTPGSKLSSDQRQKLIQQIRAKNAQ